MKGKGKGDRAAAPTDKDCPLQYPDLTPVDHVEECPKFSALLKRTLEDGISLDDTDGLQGDLETLLSSVAKRMRLLEVQINILSVWLEKGKVDKKSLGITPMQSPSASSSSSVGSSTKSSLKLSDEIPESPSSKVSKTAAPKTKELPKLSKNDTPNRFWAMIEPYCQEITTDDLKVLEEIMKTHEDDADYYKVPSLGKHYSHKWANEDLSEEQKEGFKLSDGCSGGGATDASTLLKHLDDSEDDSSPFGPLTQRLVQALMEENIMTPIDDSTISEAGFVLSLRLFIFAFCFIVDAVEAATISSRSLAKQLNLGNTATLEKRIKKELEEHGILDSDDFNSEDDPNDEVLAELRKKQQELRVLSQHNLMVTKRLYKMAKEEMQRQELRKKMATADADVMDAYRRLQAIKQKKRTPTKKEKEMAIRALKEREALVKALENAT
ncbi:hypothetical protein CAPTEDRAFT_174003 [Capitella teleta]|uniref:Transcriptional adapter 3 n=1 Tax=Capitella teleta TaxID=283909 RepID=R7TJI0_CAPTE|nr:hypothetical protein CAPTEDRAFT_174003 [Capitella teleta]|eukprot:ELT93657.1 hypothetical protein CAPTEDRAFT_174003 [Capitella teleta]